MEKILFGDGWHKLERESSNYFLWSSEKSSLLIKDKSAKFLVLTFAYNPNSNVINILHGMHSKTYILSESKNFIVFYLDKFSKSSQEIIIETKGFLPKVIDPSSSDSRTLGQCLTSIRVNDEIVPLETILFGDFLVDTKQFQPEFGLQSMEISVWGITLKSTPERERYVKTHLKSHGINFNIFYGLDAVKTGVSADILNNQKFTILDTWVTKGAVGCYISHYMLWQNIMDDINDKILIVEDDVELVDDFVFKLNESLYHVPDNWDMLYIGHESLYLVNATVVNERISRGVPACTYAYIINKKCIPTLLGLCPINMPVDTQIREQLNHKLNIYALTPQLAYQKSSILNNSSKRDPSFKSLTYDWELNPSKI